MKAIAKVKSFISNAVLRNSYYYSQREYYYIKLIDRFCTIQNYFDLIARLREKRHIPSLRRIAPIKNLEFDSTDTAQIIKEFGKPDFKFTNSYDYLKVKIFLYRQKIGRYRVRSIFHFYKDKLFLISYSFSTLPPGGKEEILETLQKKYLKQIIDPKEIYIEDNKQNIISIFEDIDLNINYLNPKCEFYTELLEYMTSKSKARHDQRVREHNMLYHRL